MTALSKLNSKLNRRLCHESHICPALPTSLVSPNKRKAVAYEEDFENIDPIIFASPKRSKGQDGTETFKSSTFVLTKAALTFKDFAAAACSPVKSAAISSRPMLQLQSPAAPKINTTTVTTNSTLSAPAGRSPTRKRIGILNRRRTDSSFKRVDPPKFSVTGPPTASAAPFSIAAALSGTIPSYREKHASTSSWASKTSSIPRSILEPEHKSGWFFDIHEDTPEETMTNLMEHGAYTLDISSDEEVERRRGDERGKENIPPLDDISQTSSRLPTASSLISDSIAEAKASSRTRSQRRRKEIEEGAIEIDRSPLGDLEAEEFYAEGHTATDVVLVEEDEGDSEDVHAQSGQTHSYDAPPEDVPSPEDTSSQTFNFSISATISLDDVDVLMTKSDTEAPAVAKLFEPLEKAEEGFEVWESASAKDEGEDEVC